MLRIAPQLLLLLVCALPAVTRAQDTGAPAPAPETDYPNSVGVFVHDSSWASLTGVMPVKTKVAHGFAASLSYGLAPAKVVAEYQGEHAAIQLTLQEPVICICHIISLPGQPAIVRLQTKKGNRELDGGKLFAVPIKGGAKIADANKSDLIPIDVSQPNPQVWLVRPQVPLDPGEYALMLGTQNLNIFPFTVVPAAPGSAAVN